jgi:hypothetical protein
MFEYGQQQEMANEVRIGKSYMSEIMRREKQANRRLAEKLEAASRKVLGVENTIPWTEFVRSDTTKNKYFKGDPKYKRL